MFHQITRNVLIMHFGECVGFIEVLPASLNLAVSLRAVGISPDPSADTSSVLFTHSFLLLHARICFILFFSFLRLFLKLPNSCHSSWLKDVALSPVNLNPSLIFGEACGAQSAWPRFFCCFFFKLDFSPWCLKKFQNSCPSPLTLLHFRSRLLYPFKSVASALQRTLVTLPQSSGMCSATSSLFISCHDM